MAQASGITDDLSEKLRFLEELPANPQILPQVRSLLDCEWQKIFDTMLTKSLLSSKLARRNGVESVERNAQWAEVEIETGISSKYNIHFHIFNLTNNAYLIPRRKKIFPRTVCDYFGCFIKKKNPTQTSKSSGFQPKQRQRKTCTSRRSRLRCRLGSFSPAQFNSMLNSYIFFFCKFKLNSKFK